MLSEARHETGWGDGLSTDAVPVWRDHPTPLALRAMSSGWMGNKIDRMDG